MESQELSRHTSFIIDNLFSALGWATSSEKNSKFSSLARALGVVFDLADTRLLKVTVSNSEHRGKEIGDTIDSFLDKGRFRKAEMESLRGRLVFAEGQVFGRNAQKAMRELSIATASSNHFVDQGLRKALVFLKDRVVKARPRSISCGPRQVLHLYTDASHESNFSGIGAVCYDSAGTELWHFGEVLDLAHIKKLNVNDSETIIGELEAMAVFAGIDIIAKKTPHVDVVAFVDNESALASMIKAGSSNDVMQQAAYLVAEHEISFDLRLWFERVPSYSNPSDGPSRGSFFGLGKGNRLNVDIDSIVDSLVNV